MTDYSKIKSTKEVKVSSKLSEQIIGQDAALELIKKASKQRRNILLIGSPGTGKSLLGQALAELLPKEDLVDIIALPNPTDENTPLIRTTPKGKAKELISKAKIKSTASFKNQTLILFAFIILTSILPYYFWKTGEISDIIYASSMITGMIFVIGMVLFLNISKKTRMGATQIPKLLVDNSEKKVAPFIDASGSHAGALLGDCLHDPLQSFSNNNKLFLVRTVGNKNNQITLQEVSFSEKINEIFSKKKIIEEESYKAAFLDENELQILAENKGEVEPTEVLSVNKYSKKDEVVKITTESGKELIVTPEHKVAVKQFRKVIYKEAQKLTRFDKVVALGS